MGSGLRAQEFALGLCNWDEILNPYQKAYHEELVALNQRCRPIRA